MTGTASRWTLAEVTAWFAGRLPDEWFVEPPTVRADREEILVTGQIAVPEVGAEATEHEREVAQRARIKGFREDTRAHRMRIADEAEGIWGRKVSWAAACGDQLEAFTSQSVPVMSRLRMPERAVLDTLIDAGVARSRSEALAWCVRLVGRHEAEWIDQLREAITHVDRVRSEGPDPHAPTETNEGKDGKDGKDATDPDA
jgi:hypothetical protein